MVSAHDKGKSWTEKIKNEVDSVLEHAVNYSDFEKKLQEVGISCEQKQFTDRKTGKAQDYILFSYFDEEKGKERKIKNTTLASRFRNEQLQRKFNQNLTQQGRKRTGASPEPVKGSRTPAFASIQVNTPDRKQEALNEQKQAIFDETREKMREADSQEERGDQERMGGSGKGDSPARRNGLREAHGFASERVGTLILLFLGGHVIIAVR